jgi:hypothetical protein
MFFIFIFLEFVIIASIPAVYLLVHLELHTKERKTALFLSIKIDAVIGVIAFLHALIKKSTTIGLVERWKNVFFVIQELNLACRQFVSIRV